MEQSQNYVKVAPKIDREREGEQIDQAMLKEVMDMYEEMDNNSVKEYYAKVVQHELLTVYASKLEEKKHLHLLANVRDEEINLSNKLLISYTSMQ
ncbi:hypothetical protein BUALT_BualtUnG0010100 [Buddleja alternifolia]|uniref:Uncharacterized protein n=1 Tax=Buddleja alternifolia TaxID=168488 RepID=A0AAV6W5R2_9LAMI|nr:hypothetical protein BUALT_BualtUnG0010100 [Buddleja alternifolia]